MYDSQLDWTGDHQNLPDKGNKAIKELARSYRNLKCQPTFNFFPYLTSINSSGEHPSTHHSRCDLTSHQRITNVLVDDSDLSLLEHFCSSSCKQTECLGANIISSCWSILFVKVHLAEAQNINSLPYHQISIIYVCFFKNFD